VKVVFLEDVPGTANIGEIKDVKPGFARNYLLPRKLAMPATASVVKSAEARAVKEARKQETRDNDARALAARIEASPFTVTAKAGPLGKLFGSVGPVDIAAKVGEITGEEFDRHNVLMPEAIKELGDYTVAVRLTRNVNAAVSVSVIGEDGTTAADIKAKTEGGDSAEVPVAEAPPAEPDAAGADEAEGDEAEDEAEG
jgi:large subunit ribosomal protein L9